MTKTWEEKKLKDVCVVDWGNTSLTKKAYVQDGRFLAVSATGGDGRINHKEHNKFTPVLSAIGAQCGKMFFPEEDFTAIKNTITLTPKIGTVNNKFLFYLLNFVTLPQRGAGQPFISKGDIEAFEVTIPSLSEQKRIVSILDESFADIDKAKEYAEKNRVNAQKLFDSFLHNIFTKTGKGWEQEKLNDVCEMINRGVAPKYVEDKGLCVLNQKCIRDHKINFELSRLHDSNSKKVNPERFVQGGDVLVNSTGVGTLGRVAQVKTLPFKAIVDTHITIVRPTKNMFYSNFFGYALIFVEEEIKNKGMGCGGQIELARDSLKNDFVICFPKDLTEQKEIACKFDVMSKETKQLEMIYQQKLADLEELKKSILQKAFNGELKGK